MNLVSVLLMLQSFSPAEQINKTVPHNCRNERALKIDQSNRLRTKETAELIISSVKQDDERSDVRDD